MFKHLFIVILFLVATTLFADYTVDTNDDGYVDTWVEEISGEKIIISSDNNFDGMVDKKLEMTLDRISLYEETDYNLDGIMDNFYYFDNGYIIRQEVDSNYDNQIDLWVYITNNGKSIKYYEKDTDFDGIIDKVKEFEVYKEEDGE